MDKYEKVVGDGRARVDMVVGFARDYGNVKVSTRISITCGQDEKTIDAAAEAAFEKAYLHASSAFATINQDLEKR